MFEIMALVTVTTVMFALTIGGLIGTIYLVRQHLINRSHTQQRSLEDDLFGAGVMLVFTLIMFAMFCSMMDTLVGSIS